MVVITDITVPSNQFALGGLFEEYPDVKIELERVVPLQPEVIPLFWVEHDDRDVIEEALRTDSFTESVKLLTETDERYLFQIQWAPEVDSFVQPLIDARADVLRAEGDVEEWEFRLQFVDCDRLTDFRKLCNENDVQIDLLRLYNPSLPDEEQTLTDEQYDILSTAYAHGYWDVPRGITLGELATLTGISDNAASQRLRRGLDDVVGQFLAPERDSLNG